VPYVDKVKSVKKTLGFPNQGERYGTKYENGVAYLLSYIGFAEFGGLIICTNITFYWTIQLFYTTLIPYWDRKRKNMVFY
jgi:hypothetical protein